MSDGEEPRLAQLRDIEQVYQPAEDSHLLAETVIEGVGSNDVVLDVGTGSGYVAEYVREQTGASVVGVDLNPMACTEAHARGVPVVRGNLVSCFRKETFDVICFNPPYLPSAPEGVWDDWMEKAVTGGEDGRAVIAAFLDDVGRVLRPDGEIYLLISTVTGLDEVRTATKKAGFEPSVLAEESHSFEKLLVLGLTPVSE